MRCSVIGLIYAGHDPKLNANRIVLILELSMFLDFVSLKYIFFYIYIYILYSVQDIPVKQATKTCRSGGTVFCNTFELIVN